MAEDRVLGGVGTKLLFENDRVKVWEMALEPGEESAVHRHELDYVMVQVDGDRMAGVSEPDSEGPYPGYIEGDVSRGNVLTAKRGRHRNGPQRGQEAVLRDHRRTEGLSPASVSLTGMDVVTRVDDTITAEVIRNALAVAVEEASIVVVRSSHSTWIQEGADAAGALLDADGQLVAQSTATSLMHGASLRTSLPYLLEVYPAPDMRPGDVYALNDPYKGGIHANDILVFRPIFADGRGAPTWPAR